MEKMRLATLKSEYIMKLLRKQSEFSDLDTWKLEHIDVGEMQHKYKLSKGDKIYLVKEVKPHEAQVIYFLYHLKLPSLPSTSFPELLKHKILVRKYILGDMLKSRKLDSELIREFATFQNRMNDKSFFDRYNNLGIENYSQKDDGFFRRYTGTESLNHADERLKQLSAMYTLKIIQQFWEISEQIEKDKRAITDTFSNMPFARQHHDFREDNIIGKPQKLIDWGSSYGYGPFLFDLAPFLVNDPSGLETYIKTSDICRNASMMQIERWIYVARLVCALSVCFIFSLSHKLC